MNISLNFIYEENDCSPELPAHTIDCFFRTGKTICQLEAQSFLSDENKLMLSESKNKFYEEIQKLYPTLVQTVQKILDSSFLDDLNSTKVSLISFDWRLILGIMLTFEEWIDDTSFLMKTKKEKRMVLQENPVVTFFKLA